MSQKQCPICHYTFMKKKDYMEHVTYSSCSESLHDILVICQHCNKQFSNDDGLAYHLMRNESCSRKHDKAYDILNRLPNQYDANIPGKTKRQKQSSGDNTDDFSFPVYNIQQGVNVHDSNKGHDNQRRFYGNTSSCNTTFIPLDQIQRGDNESRPYFPIETMQHTQSWRQHSAIDPDKYSKDNEHLSLAQNITSFDVDKHRRKNEGIFWWCRDSILSL
jgi:hypothetical protein